MYAVYELLIFNLGLSDLFVSFQRLNYGVFRTWYYYLLQSIMSYLISIRKSHVAVELNMTYKIQRELEKSNAKIKSAKILSYQTLVVAFGWANPVVPKLFWFADHLEKIGGPRRIKY